MDDGTVGGVAVECDKVEVIVELTSVVAAQVLMAVLTGGWLLLPWFASVLELVLVAAVL